MSDDGQSGLPTINSLEQVHDFPCSYMVKAFGPNTDGFEDEVKRIAEEVSGLPHRVAISSRTSSKGNHRAVTATVYMQSAHQVQALYVELQQIPTLRLLL